jgi:hypothetical protein
VAIGVAIAALVLGGFLLVKFLVLDIDSPETAPPTSTFATLRVSLATGAAASVYVDDRMVGTFRDGQEFKASAGAHKVRLLGQSGSVCLEQTLNLSAGQAVVLPCVGAAAPGPGAGSAAAGSAAAATGGSAGSAADVGSGSASAGSASAGSASVGSASAGTAAADATTDHPAPDKTDRMPVEDKSSAGEHTDKPARRGHAPDRPSEKPHATPSKPASTADDDPLGKLQGGVKPGDRKPKSR